MKTILLATLIPILAYAQNLQDVLKQGEQVFSQSCATGYCHGVKGIAAGAPRLAARGFDQAYINNVVSRGISGTAMPAFGSQLKRDEVTAVVAYVATLNGIASPNIAAGGRGGAAPGGPPEKTLSADAAKGRGLFQDALRGFGRCATCHEVERIGISVATPIMKVPMNAGALRALLTPNVSTVTLGGESMPALVLSRGIKSVVFYDLTLPPPVLHTADPATVKLTDGSAWRHSSVLTAYSDSELNSVLAYLRAVSNP
jgi:mono/diheme cytochrome c family protein